MQPRGRKGKARSFSFILTEPPEISLLLNSPQLKLPQRFSSGPQGLHPMPTEQLKPREKPITTGEPAPDFTLKDQNRKDWNLAENLKKGDVALCFFPLA